MTRDCGIDPAAALARGARQARPAVRGVSDIDSNPRCLHKPESCQTILEAIHSFLGTTREPGRAA